MAAPAAIDLFSFSPTCSILKASTVISCVDEAIAITRPIDISSAKFSDGFIKLHSTNEIKITNCIKTIQPRLWPIFFVRKGICILSIKGAHK